MRESEAKTKLCPHIAQVNAIALISVAIASAKNPELSGQVPDSPNSCCIGSDCMMWHSIEYDTGDQIYNKGEGYCGLS